MTKKEIMTKTEVDIIRKIKISDNKKDIIENIPEIIYRNMISKYAETIRTEEEIGREWSSVFLDEIATQYSKKDNGFDGFELISTIEFSLEKRKFQSKRISSSGKQDKVFKDGLFSLAKDMKFDFPLEAEQTAKLLNILWAHIVKTSFKDEIYNEVDSYTKSLLKNFKNEFQNRELVEDSQLDSFGFEAYPSILFAENTDYLIAITMKPNNLHYIDNKVQEIDKVFEISFAIYNNTKSNEKIHYRGLSNYFNSFSMFLYKEKLDATIKDSIGEAADIARYWYTEGLRKLNNMQDIFDNSMDSFEFSEAFIREILVADIEGVESIEIYPFDRCFIFKDSALVDEKSKSSAENSIVVSEGLLLQKSISTEDVIKKRGNYLYEWERFHQDTKDYDIDFSKKSTEFKSFNIEPTDGGHLELVFNDDAKAKLNYQSKEVAKDFKIDDEKAIDFMLHNLLQKDAVAKDILDLEKKYFNNDDGLCYVYINGVNLNNMPILKSLQKAYWENMKQIKIAEYKEKNPNVANSELPDIFNFDKFIKEVDVENTKVVFVSYDPSRAKSGKNIDIDSKHAFSILIIANWDVPKTISETSAEKEDLNTALKLIVRQKTESAELIKHEREKQKKFISNQLRQAIHAIKGSVNDPDVKKEIDAVYREFKKKLEDDQQELKEHDIINKCKDVRVETLFKRLMDTSFKLDHPTELWDLAAKNMLLLDFNEKPLTIKDETIIFKLQESFIPDLRIKLDNITVQEAFHVMLKNAVESTLATKLKSIIVSMNINYINDKEGIINICFINDTAPISQERILLMNTAKDDIEKNKDKEGSTGSGVASSRNQLESRFGEHAKIQFRLLTPTKIKSILSLPVELIYNKEYYKQKGTDNEAVVFEDIFYLEDEDEHYSPSIKFLSGLGLKCTHSDDISLFKNNWNKANILFTDINVLNNGKKMRAGVNAIKDFHEVNRTGTIFVLTSESPSDLIPKFKNIHTTLIHEGIKSIEKGHIYILDYKTIGNACDAYPALLKFIKQNHNEAIISSPSFELEISQITSLNLPKEFLKLKSFYQYKVIEQNNFENLFNEWDENNYYHPEEELDSDISNPDVFTNILIVPVIVKELTKIDYSKISLFGLKNNMLIIPITKKQDINISDSLLLQNRHTIDLRSIGIFSALNHDLLNIKDDDIAEITKVIGTLKIYDDGKSLTPTNIFDSGRNEDAEIDNLYRQLNTVLETKKELADDLNPLKDSLKYFIDIKSLLKELGL